MPQTRRGSRSSCRVSGETLLDIGPDLVGIFVPGAALFAKLAASLAANSKLASKLAERMGKSGKDTAGPTPNPNLDQEKILQQYAEVLKALAREHTLLLILDDLQWADSASLNLLFHLARQLKEAACCWWARIVRTMWRWDVEANAIRSNRS